MCFFAGGAWCCARADARARAFLARSTSCPLFMQPHCDTRAQLPRDDARSNLFDKTKGRELVLPSKSGAHGCEQAPHLRHCHSGNCGRDFAPLSLFSRGRCRG